MSNDGTAQLNDFGNSHIIGGQGFDNTSVSYMGQNIRFTAPELVPVDEQAYDVAPTFQSDIFSLAMLLLQVCRCPHCVQMLIKSSSCPAISRT